MLPPSRILLKHRNPDLENLDVLEESLRRAADYLKQSLVTRSLLHEQMVKQVRTKFCDHIQRA